MATVFICHRRNDASDAERLAKEISRNGHLVWLDSSEIAVGDSIIGKMNEGLTSAAYLVLCYSSSGVSSPWMSREWMSALARQLNGLNVKILPVRLTGGDPPSILADLKYADLSQDWSEGIEELKAAIN